MIKELLNAQNLAQARAKLYQLLATIYTRPPTPDFLKLLSEWTALQRTADSDSQLLSEQMRQGLTTMADFLERTGEGSHDESVEAVAVEFTRLFRGVKPYYSPLPPYESVYREEPGRVFGELTHEVRQEYRRFGLDLVGNNSGEPPDHLSFELEFMHLLCHQEAEAWERDDEGEASRLLVAESEFLQEHLLTWLPKLCSEIKEYDRLGLFCGLADLTEGWITYDYREHLHSD